MADELLSQAERDLLRGDKRAELSGAGAGYVRIDSAVGPPRRPASLHDVDRSRGTAWDEALLRLTAIQEECGRQFAQALAGPLRMTLAIQPRHIELTTWREFTRQLAERSYCCWLAGGPELEAPLLELTPNLLFPALHRLLGGGHERVGDVGRPLTDIERRLATRLAQALAQAYGDVWPGGSVELTPRIHAGDPPLAAHDESAAELVWQVTIGPNAGLMRLWLPEAALARLTEQTPSQASMSGLQGPNAEFGPDTIELVAELAQTTISRSDALDLSVGDIITTEHDVSRPIELRAATGLTLLGELGQFRGHKAVRVTPAEDVARPEHS